MSPISSITARICTTYMDGTALFITPRSPARQSTRAEAVERIQYLGHYQTDMRTEAKSQQSAIAEIIRDGLLMENRF